MHGTKEASAPFCCVLLQEESADIATHLLYCLALQKKKVILTRFSVAYGICPQTVTGGHYEY